MAREIEREQVVDELLVVHGLAGLGIARRDEAVHEVLRALGRIAALAEHARDGGTQGRDRLAAPAHARTRKPARQVQLRHQELPAPGTLHRADCTFDRARKRRVRREQECASARPRTSRASCRRRCAGRNREAARATGRSTSSAARTNAGTKPASSCGLNIGAAAWRCHFQCAPSLVRMPLPSMGPRSRICVSLRKLSRWSSSTAFTIAGPVTQTRGELGPPSGTKSSSYAALGRTCSGLRTNVATKESRPRGWVGGTMQGGMKRSGAVATRPAYAPQRANGKNRRLNAPGAAPARAAG